MSPPATRDLRRRPRSLSQSTRIRNRRKRYLERHTSYFGPSLESADPLLYDRLIRTHQTDTERTTERTTKGFAGTLEADLLRSEAKLDEVRGRQPATPTNGGSSGGKHQVLNGTTNGGHGDGSSQMFTGLTRDEAKVHWVDVMTARFVNGGDEEFEYAVIDGDEGFDDRRGEERELEEGWFDEEDDEEEELEGGSEDRDERGRGVKRELLGETGVQDF